MQLLDKRVVESIKKLREGGTSWLREQASHWTTADSLALVLEDQMKDDYICPDCAQEGWVMTDTEDPDIWGEHVLYGEREEWPPYDTNEKDERPITLMVIEDLLARDRMGHEKHGRPLTKSTYTDFHKELYEELMDALVYLRALRENND